MSAERERIKRAMGIGEHPAENDLSANEFRVTTYIHANGEKYAVTFSNGEVFTTIPGRVIIRDTIEQLRDAVIAALAEPKAETAVMAAIVAIMSGRQHLFRAVP